MTQSSTQAALALIAASPLKPDGKHELSQAAAARMCGLHWSTVSKARKARSVPRCQHCGQTLPKVAA